MPPKNTKDKLATEKKYNFLTLEEMEAKDQKFTSHVKELRACSNFIDDAISQVAQQEEKQLLIDKWQNFVNCFPLPKPYKPADIRLYIAKLKHFEDLNIKKNIDWILSVDERSILTQNIFRKDLTQKSLKNEIKPDFGYEYDEIINNCLNVLRLIRYFLDNNVEVAKCSQDKLEDIKQTKIDLEQAINKYFDRYTYRILCSEDAYMLSVDPITAEYWFSSDNFRIHLWCLKNVPIRFELLDEPRLIANFHELNIALQIPSFMLQQNLTIRAIHQNYDHITEYAKSFSQEIVPEISPENLNASIQSLPECLLNERLMQLNIQNRIRNDMMAKRLEYEEQLRLYEEEIAKKKNKKVEEGNDKKVKRTKFKKPTKEPPVITSDVYPDVWMDFLIEEQQQYEEFINRAYNPDSMELDSDEINLKKYFILGGIYQLYYVCKPKHYDFNQFNVTWHQDDSKTLIIDKDLSIPYSAQFSGRRSTKVFKRLTTRNIASKEGIEKQSTDTECPWFILTIKLPEYLCSWGEPIACHYETVTKVVEEKSEELIESAFETETNKKKSKKAEVAKPLLQPSSQTEIKNESIPEALSEYYSFLEPLYGDGLSSVLKIKYSPDNLSRTSLRSIEDFSRHFDNILNIKDFDLTQNFTKSQVRNLTKHLVPRIISSFKFPKELKEDDLESNRNKTKSKEGGVLVRKQPNNAEDIEIEMASNIFMYNQNQTNPERVFCVYPAEEPLKIIQKLYDEGREISGPKSFSQLVKILDNIKKCYALRLRKILDLKPFKSKNKRGNKRSQVLRSKVKSTVSDLSLGTLLTKSRSFIGDKQKSLVKSTSNMGKDPKDVLSGPSVTNTLDDSLKEDISDSLVFEQKSKIQKTFTYSHWTTQHILKSEYDKMKCTIRLQTDRLGYIGFAFKRYEHFPFKYWNLEPSPTDPENEVIFTLETQYVRCILYITGDGIRGHVTEPTTIFKRNPKMYLVIDKPMKDFTEFKKIFKDKFLNIFADQDALYYIENGYFCEKHLATELHTYNCMALNSTQIKFNYSQWNRLSKRRDLILQFVQFKDLPENVVEVRITPEESYFVDISELCSDNIDIINLEYKLTWRNISTFSDLHHLINSMYPAAVDLRCKNSKLITCIRNLLKEIRPLSFS